MTLFKKSLLVAGLTVGLNVGANAGDSGGVIIDGEEVSISSFDCWNDQVMKLNESIETRKNNMDQSKPDESKYRESGEWKSDDLKKQYMDEVKKHEEIHDPENIAKDDKMLEGQLSACVLEYCYDYSQDGLAQIECMNRFFP